VSEQGASSDARTREGGCSEGVKMARLVAIGDSLTQGFHSLAITNTDQSYPAMIASAMGLAVDEFRLPDFRGRGGLPLSVEWLARNLEDRYGATMSTFEWIKAMHAIPDLIDDVEDYWERGKGSLASADELYHNLAVWGFEVGDAYQLDAARCFEQMGKPKDNWFAPPSQPRYRTALKVLNPARTDARAKHTQIEVAREIKEREGGIDHLIVWLGANNCLGTVVELAVRRTDKTPPGPMSNSTLWLPEAFRLEYEELADRIAAIGAKHVYLATVPHVTIPPITRGVMKDRGRLPKGEKYFDYYTRFFIRDKDFDQGRDPHLTKKQAIEIDQCIDEYNNVIRAEQQKRGWDLVDMCKVLDDLAVRRNHGQPTYRLPDAVNDLTIRFFEIQPGGGVKSGGLIGLDGVHPTACGYAVVAQEFINVMRRHEPKIRNIDFNEIRRFDTLVSKPPQTLNDMIGALEMLERRFHVSRWMRG
jgi:GDSL-like Lipase/Acylhydrolase